MNPDTERALEPADDQATAPRKDAARSPLDGARGDREAVEGPEPAGRGPTAETATLEFRVHPLVPRLWFWQSLVFPSALGAVAATSLLAAGHAALGTLAMAAAGAAAWAATRHARAYAERLRLYLLPDGLLVRRGVWWRAEIFVPRARVQHTDVSQGPLGRHFGVATLKVFTAASHAGVISVEGLDRTDAVAVRDRLLGRGDPDAV